MSHIRVTLSPCAICVSRPDLGPTTGSASSGSAPATRGYVRFTGSWRPIAAAVASRNPAGCRPAPRFGGGPYGRATGSPRWLAHESWRCVWMECGRGRARVRPGARARRRASLLASLRRGCANCARLAIHEVGSLVRASARGAVREIPLDAIMGSVEPDRATLFDREFRPSAPARGRWLSVWHAEQRGAGLPPSRSSHSMMGMRSVTATTACPLPGRAERSASSPRSLERRLRRYRASAVAPRELRRGRCTSATAFATKQERGRRPIRRPQASSSSQASVSSSTHDVLVCGRKQWQLRGMRPPKPYADDPSLAGRGKPGGVEVYSGDRCGPRKLSGGAFSAVASGWPPEF